MWESWISIADIFISAHCSSKSYIHSSVHCGTISNVNTFSPQKACTFPFTRLCGSQNMKRHLKNDFSIWYKFVWERAQLQQIDLNLKKSICLVKHSISIHLYPHRATSIQESVFRADLHHSPAHQLTSRPSPALHMDRDKRRCREGRILGWNKWQMLRKCSS